MTADADDFAVWENKLQGRNVVRGKARRQSVRAAGIFSYVATNGAGFLAGRIRGEIEAGVFDGSCDIQIDNSRLNNGAAVSQV